MSQGRVAPPKEAVAKRAPRRCAATGRTGVCSATGARISRCSSRIFSGNARFARSLFEQAYARMAARAAADGTVSVDELNTLLAEDIDDDLGTLTREMPRIGF